MWRCLVTNVLRYRKGTLRLRRGWCYLPHSCDEWIVGDKEVAQELIDDLLLFINDEYEMPEDPTADYDD